MITISKRSKIQNLLHICDNLLVEHGSHNQKSHAGVKAFNSQSDAGAYGKEAFADSRKTLTKSEIAAVGNYRDTSDQINGTLRNPEKWTPGAAKKSSIVADELDSAINKSVFKDDVVVYRGMPSSVVGKGKTISDKGFVSTSLSRKAAEGFVGDGVLAEINVHKGQKGLYIEGLGSRSNQKAGRNEHEVILPRGSKFKITGTRKEGNRTIVTMEPM